MAGIDFQALRRQIGMAAVLKLLGFAPARRQGSQVRGPCPVHQSPRAQNASFSANLARNAYRCFHCGSSGNQLDLWAAATRQPLHQAAIELCAKLDHPIPWLPCRQTGRTKSTPST
jgi:DNA primase